MRMRMESRDWMVVWEHYYCLPMHSTFIFTFMSERYLGYSCTEYWYLAVTTTVIMYVYFVSRIIILGRSSHLKVPW